MPRKQPKRSSQRKPKRQPPVFGAINYRFMALGGGLIFLGFAIMAFENAIDGFLSLFVSPILVIAGFVVFGFGIARKSRNHDDTPVSQQN